MSWRKDNVDDIINVQIENERTIGRVIKNLDTVKCMYTQMRAMGLIFESNILQLVESLDIEGGQAIKSTRQIASRQIVGFDILQEWVRLGGSLTGGVPTGTSTGDGIVIGDYVQNGTDNPISSPFGISLSFSDLTGIMTGGYIFVSVIGITCHPCQSQIDHYNTLLCNFMNQINLFLTSMRSNQSGIRAPLIGAWSNISSNGAGKTTTYFIQYKQPKYAWTNRKPICIVDNIKINGSCEICPTVTSVITISVGGSAIAATILNIAIDTTIIADTTLDSAGDNPTFIAFRNYLCSELPNQIHQLCTYFTKNIELIDNCIKAINKLVETIGIL